MRETSCPAQRRGSTIGPLLKVFTDKQKDNTGLNVAPQVIGDSGYPIAEVAYKYVYGKSLVRPEEVDDLPTQLRKLHKWYMQAAKEGKIYIMAWVKKEHYFQEYGVHIDFPELFQLYNKKPSTNVSSVAIVCKWFISVI